MEIRPSLAVSKKSLPFISYLLQLAQVQATLPLVNSLCLTCPPHLHCLITYPQLSTRVLFGGCLSKAQPYRTKTGFALCLVLPGAMPSHRTIPDYFNHRALGIRPRSRLWLARVTGYPKPDHRRTASDRPKAKTPESLSVVLALGRAAAKRLEQPKVTLATYQDHTETCGGLVVPLAQLPHRTNVIIVLFSRLSSPCKPLGL